jgi:hypothetical protein
VRRTDILNGIQQVITALETCHLKKIFLAAMRNARQSTELSNIPEILDALRNYSLLAHSYNTTARQIAEILDLTDLENPQVWSSLLSKEPLSILNALRWNVSFAVEHLPKLSKLIEPEYIQKIEHDEQNRFDNMKVLSVTVYEPPNTLSSPVRLANVLEGINDLYTACALMNNESPSTLSVIGLDSGSDKSFDFLGLAKIVECVERLIGTIWEKVFFFREHQFEERLELVAQSLPIIAQIKKMEENKEIEPEMAKILTRNIVEGTNKFVESGAAIPKIEDTSEYNPRTVLSPVQKLLVAAPDGDTDESTAEHEEARKANETITQEQKGEDIDDVSLNSLSEDEQRILRQLLKKTRNEESAPPSEGKSDLDVEGTLVTKEEADESSN